MEFGDHQKSEHMKIFKNVLLGVAAIPLLYLFTIAIYFLFQPNVPEEVSKIAGADWDLSKEFHALDLDYWEKKEDRLLFNSQSTKKEKAQLYSRLIPSEHKKKGYIKMSVKVPGHFDLLADDALYGFQIGEEGTMDKDQIFMGLNGKGDVFLSDGNFEILETEDVSINNRNISQKNLGETLDFSLHYYRNPKGWIFYFRISDGTESRAGGVTYIINRIPAEKFDEQNKVISLVAFNPSQKGELWFKDWTIQNDWTPND